MSCNRPDGYTHEKNDCTVRALTKVSGLKYEDVHSAFKACGRRDKRPIRSDEVIKQVCKILNLKSKKVKRSGTLNKFMDTKPLGNYYCRKSGHVFALVNGKVYDENIIGSRLKGVWEIKLKEVKQ